MRTAGVFGFPMRRPHSKLMFDAVFEAYGIDAEYRIMEVTEEEFLQTVPTLRAPEWLGFQVTAPYKRTVLPLLDSVESSAQEVGAVNSVHLSEAGRLVGFNTDSTGFVRGLAAALDVSVRNRRVVVAGSGGAGHAVVHGVLTGGAAQVTVMDLDVSDVERLASEFAGLGTFEALAFGDARVTSRLAEAELFVNATTVGMLSPGPVVEVAGLSSAATVFDVVYSPSETELVRQARRRGLPAANGLEMLIAQGAATFMRWTGLSDPSPVMREALRAWLRSEEI